MRNQVHRHRSSGRVPSLIAIVATVLLAPEHASAYVGPGAGLTAIGTVLALVGAVLLAIVGVVWYPMKRLLRRRTSKRPPLDDRGNAA